MYSCQWTWTKKKELNVLTESHGRVQFVRKARSANEVYFYIHRVLVGGFRTKCVCLCGSADEILAS